MTFVTHSMRQKSNRTIF